MVIFFLSVCAITPLSAWLTGSVETRRGCEVRESYQSVANSSMPWRPRWPRRDSVAEC